MLGWLTHRFPKRDLSKGSTRHSSSLLFDSVSIRLTVDGFELREEERVVAGAKWADIVEARAFKRDLITTDLICVLCRIGTGSDDDSGVEVHGEMPGFAGWMNALPAHLPGVEADWFGLIMLPPMKTCERLIWRRD